MGAIAYTKQVQDSLYVGAHGSTFGGNPLACAAGLAAIQAYQDKPESSGPRPPGDCSWPGWSRS